MKQLYILGSGGFAKEVYALASQVGKFEVKGFVDIGGKKSIKIGNVDLPVLNEEELLHISNDQIALVVGIGDPKIISKVTKRFAGKFEFPNIIHPNVVANWDDIKLGVGNVFTANVVLTTSIEIGSFNIFNLSCTVGHDSVIGDCNVLNPSVNISGGVIIGNQNLLGVNSTVLQYKTIGNQTTIGASSLVTKDVQDNTVVLGVPAKKMEK